MYDEAKVFAEGCTELQLSEDSGFAETEYLRVIMHDEAKVFAEGCTELQLSEDSGFALILRVE
jgi:hypothetical protein